MRTAELELEENGIEGFSLRAVAKRAGVSHAAPAHHFTDANGLLTGLAEVAFRRFVATQKEAMASAEKNSSAQLAASGLGYVRFALASPALFRLIFSSGRPDFDEPGLQAAAFAGYELLVRLVHEVTGVDPRTNEKAMLNVNAAWATAHGLADLLVAGRLSNLAALPQDRRDAAILEIISRSVV